MTIITKSPWKLALGIPLCIFLACFFITLSSKFKSDPQLLSNAIVLDLLVTAPLAYLLVIRKSSISKLTVSRVFIAGLLVAGWILNHYSNTLLQVIKTWISPAIEGTLLFFIGRKFYVANKKAKRSGIPAIDFLPHCRMVLQQVTGSEKAGNIIGSEIAMFYYSIFGRKSKAINYQSSFTSYRENGILLILVTFLCLFLIETTGVHFLLALWNQSIAWVLTGLSLYTCLQLVGHIRAIKARPIVITGDSVEIHNGLAADAHIKYDNIEKIEFSKRIPAGGKVIKIALIKGLENHNCIIYLKAPIEVTKIFGIKKQATVVLFFVDRIADFRASLALKMIEHDNYTGRN